MAFGFGFGLRIGRNLLSLGGFVLSKLFSASEKGVLLDPSTAGTLYQTTAMQIPSLPGDPVGVVLDQSQWGGTKLNTAGATTAEKLAPVLGPELVINGGFDADTDWNKQAGWTISGGTLNAAIPSGFTDVRTSTSIALIGKTYQVTFDLVVSSGGVRVHLGGVTDPVTISSSGTKTLILTAASTSYVGFIAYGPGGTFYGSIDNVSVREIPGNHATQATAAKRPTYGIHPFGGRRNLLTQTENFADAVWLKINATTENLGDVVKLIPSSAASVSHYVNQSSPDFRSVRLLAKPLGTITKLTVYPGGSARFAHIDLSNGTSSNEAGVESVNVVALADGWFDVSVVWPDALVADKLRLYASSGTTGSSATTENGTDGMLFKQIQTEDGAAATPYQKVVTQYEVTEAGVPSVHYLYDDLVDDALPATLPDLGTNATVAYATEAGTTILTGQTVAAGAFATLRGQRTYVVFAVNRALTAAETTKVTAMLDKKRGAEPVAFSPAFSPAFA